MRAIVVREFGPPEGMAIEEWPTPEPGPSQVRVEVHAIGINHQDLLVIGGRHRDLPPPPFVPGTDAAGVVRAVGERVRHCLAGDRVLVHLRHGAYAEQVLGEDESTFVIPKAMSFVEAAAMGLAYQTAHFALIDRGRFTAGETVLVTGAGGGVGLAAIQLVKALDGKALAATRSPAKADAIRAAGADAIIDLSAATPGDALREQVLAATGGRGVDVVLDTIGGDLLEAAIEALASRGRLVLIGSAAGPAPRIRADQLLARNLSVSGLRWSDYRDRDPVQVRLVQMELFGIHEAGKLRPQVMRTFPLEEFAAALNLLASGEVAGKLVLTTTP